MIVSQNVKYLTFELIWKKIRWINEYIDGLFCMRRHDMETLLSLLVIIRSFDIFPVVEQALAIDLCDYSDVIMSTMASQITSLTILYSTVYLGVNQRNRQSSASLAFVRGIHRWPVTSPHKDSDSDSKGLFKVMIHTGK